jgi:hypothetical protein
VESISISDFKIFQLMGLHSEDKRFRGCEASNIVARTGNDHCPTLLGKRLQAD